MPALDRYDDRDIDDEEVGETFEEREQARLRAEREMDRAQGVRRTRLPAALLEGRVCSYWTWSSIQAAGSAALLLLQHLCSWVAQEHSAGGIIDAF